MKTKQQNHEARQQRWEDAKANVVGRLVFSENTHPGLYQWLLQEYSDGDRLRGRDVLKALETLRAMQNEFYY